MTCTLVADCHSGWQRCANLSSRGWVDSWACRQQPTGIPAATAVHPGCFPVVATLGSGTASARSAAASVGEQGLLHHLPPPPTHTHIGVWPCINIVLQPASVHVLRSFHSTIVCSQPGLQPQLKEGSTLLTFRLIFDVIVPKSDILFVGASLAAGGAVPRAQQPLRVVCPQAQPRRSLLPRYPPLHPHGLLPWPLPRRRRRRHRPRPPPVAPASSPTLKASARELYQSRSCPAFAKTNFKRDPQALPKIISSISFKAT